MNLADNMACVDWGQVIWEIQGGGRHPPGPLREISSPQLEFFSYRVNISYCPTISKRRGTLVRAARLPDVAVVALWCVPAI